MNWRALTPVFWLENLSGDLGHGGMVVVRAIHSTLVAWIVVVRGRHAATPSQNRNSFCEMWNPKPLRIKLFYPKCQCFFHPSWSPDWRKHHNFEMYTLWLKHEVLRCCDFSKNHEKTFRNPANMCIIFLTTCFVALEALARVWPYFVLLWRGSDASHPWQVPWRAVPVPVLYLKSCMELLAMNTPLKSTTWERRKNQTVQPKTPKKATKN